MWSRPAIVLLDVDMVMPPVGPGGCRWLPTSTFLKTQTPETWSRPSIVLLDVGMATHLSDRERLQMVDLFRAFTRLDGSAMAATALAFSGDEQGCPDPEVRAAHSAH